MILHRLSRHFAHGTQDPYRALFHVLREGRTAAELAAAERAAATDERALDAYRAGEACHPLLPFADWASCRPALDRLGAVLVAGCRDHQAARALGFVPTHGSRTRARDGARPRRRRRAHRLPALAALLPARGGRADADGSLLEEQEQGVRRARSRRSAPARRPSGSRRRGGRGSACAGRARVGAARRSASQRSASCRGCGTAFSVATRIRFRYCSSPWSPGRIAGWTSTVGNAVRYVL